MIYKYLSNNFYNVFKYTKEQLKNNKNLNIKSCELIFNEENKVEKINFKYFLDGKEVIISDIFNDRNLRITAINYNISKYKVYF